MSIDLNVLASGLGLQGEDAATYAADRLRATEDAELIAYLHKIAATHYSRYLSGEVEAYKPGASGWLTCTLLPPKGRVKRWRYKAAKAWQPGRKPESAVEIGKEPK